jgi:hypothetical protein
VFGQFVCVLSDSDVEGGILLFSFLFLFLCAWLCYFVVMSPGIFLAEDGQGRSGLCSS